MPSAFVLVADISGSTDLYERVGNDEALKIVNRKLVQMRHIIGEEGGIFIGSKGDDVLAYFENADAAFEAAVALVERNRDDLSVHAGLSFGDFLEHDNDIFGQPVNTAARLADMAKPAEVVLTETCYARMSPAGQLRVTGLGTRPMKGLAVGTELYAYTAGELQNRTVFVPLHKSRSEAKSARLHFGHREWGLQEGGSLTIGRSNESTIVVAQPWVSRNHATVTMSKGLVEYDDHSSAGSIVQTEAGQPLSIHRKTMVLTGRGTILLGAQNADRALCEIRFGTDLLNAD